MATNFVQNGDNLTIASPGAVTSGDGVLVGSLFGVASHDAENGQPVTIATRGVYTLPKISAQAWAVGEPIYWDVGEDKASDVQGTGDVLIGVAVAIAANPSDTGLVRLNGAVVV